MPNGRLTPDEFELASFWVRNRWLLRRLGYGSLIGCAALLWGYASWGLVDAYAVSYPRESRLTREMAVNQQLLAGLEADRPQNVNLSDVTVFSTTAGRYNLAVEVTNQDEQWWAEFNYRFNLSGEQTPLRSGYVLPKSVQVLTEFGYQPKTRGGASASLVIENVRWHRVDPSLVGVNYQEFADKRLKLTFQELTYDTSLVIGNKAVGQTSFILVNGSAYGYWSVDLIVRIYRGSSPVGITKLTVTNVSPGERRPIKLTWFETLPNVTRTEIIPQVNLLDRNVYLPTTYFKE